MSESVKILQKRLANMTQERDNLRAELDELRKRMAKALSGICINGWWCPCETFNGEEHSPRTECRRCAQPKPKQEYRPHAARYSLP